MRYLLNLLYLLLLAICLPWLLYAAIRHGKYRAGFGEKFLGRAPRRDGERICFWLHAVSVGEVNLLKPLLTQLEQTHPDFEFVISTTTKAGYELARQKYAPRSVFYCPLDFSWSVSNAMRRVRPDLLILAELELWPNLIDAARRRGVPVAIVNGRLSERSFRGYRRIRFFVQRVLQQLRVIAVQNDEYAQRFLALGAPADAVQVTGSIKFDGAQTDRGNPATQRLAAAASINSDDIVFLAGSTQTPEEALALTTFRELSATQPKLRLILVPRHPERFAEVATLLDQSGVAWQRRSQLAASPTQSEFKAPTRVLLVDTVGELGAWWGTAHIAFVGGSMGTRGGQNMIEPAGYGAAISFGPNTQNFRDVVALLLEQNAATVVRDGQELTAFVRRVLTDESYARGLGERARQFVISQTGATARTIVLLTSLLPAAARHDHQRPAA